MEDSAPVNLLARRGKSPPNTTGRTLGVIVVVAGLLGARAVPAAPPPEEGERTEAKPAKLKVSGYGFIGNLRLKQNLRILRPEKEKFTVLDADVLEDAALLLMAAVRGDGYLRATIDVELTLEDGGSARHQCAPEARLELPRETRAREATFTVHRGVLYHYGRLEFEGLRSLSVKEAETYFLSPDFVFRQKKNRIFTEDRLNRSIANLCQELVRLGFNDVQIQATRVHQDHASGAVDVTLTVRENQRYWVRTVAVSVLSSTNEPPVQAYTHHLREPYSRTWEQALRRTLRNEQYRLGFAEAQVRMEAKVVSESAEERDLEAFARILRGPEIQVGSLTYDGLKRTKESVVRQRTKFAEGDRLNRLSAEEARYQMLRLGIFDQAEVGFTQTERTNAWEVRYTLREAKPIGLSLMAGYGSYELLRGGIELEQINLFGLAHRHRLLAVQSFKATTLEYAYTIPQAFDVWGDVTAGGYFREREETTFTRRDYGGSVGYNRFLAPIQSDVGLRYNYEQLETRDNNFNPVFGVQQATATSLALKLDHNQTDNPLDPMRGYKLEAGGELAFDQLGGDVNYQRVELGGAWHVTPLRWLVMHTSVSHGLVTTPGDVTADLPFNKRFFLGGASTVRGYTQGEAASRDRAGKLVGDESYLLGHVELEQRLTEQWSVVEFVDVAGIARDIRDYPAREVLASAGGGVRLRTPLGPVRLEYGFNLNPRRGDPTGTIHFSIGYPF